MSDSNWTREYETNPRYDYFETIVRVTAPVVSSTHRAVHSKNNMGASRLLVVREAATAEVVNEILEDPEVAKVVAERTKRAYNEGLLDGRTTSGGYYL